MYIDWTWIILGVITIIIASYNSGYRKGWDDKDILDYRLRESQGMFDDDEELWENTYADRS